MEPLLILVPGVLGGIAVALLVFRLDFGAAGRRRLEPPSAGLINIARIRVDGIGGLGMVAMAVTVAIFVPAIRFAMATALVSGAALAAILIARRRSRGPLPSANDTPGANAVLDIEGALDRRPSAAEAPEQGDHRRGHMRASHA
jgi:hypothetical protein